MKNFKLLCLLSLTALVLFGCGFGKMVPRYPEISVSLENPDLENKGGKVEYTVKGTIPPKYLKKKATMTVEPTVKIGGENVMPPFATIKLVGEKSKEAGIKIPYKTGGNFTKSGSFDFKDGYEEAQIVALANASLKKEICIFPEKILGEGISNTSSLIGMSPVLSDNSGSGTILLYAPHNYKPEFVTDTAIIYFEVNSSVLNWNLKLNKDAKAKEEIKKFVEFLGQGRKIDKVIVVGWASPEGEESKNQGLSERRFEQGKKWFNEQYDKYIKDYCKANKIKMKDFQKPELVFENHANGEDWTGFEVAVENSNIPEKNKILNVVLSQTSNEMREQKIREMIDIYKEIADVILPPLRRAVVTMVCNKNNYNDQQIMELATTDPSQLSLNERLYAASLTKDLGGKANIYAAIIKDANLQGDWRAYNNLGIIRLNDYYTTNNNAYLKEAKDDLNKANAVSPNNGTILNNLAIAEFLSGNYDAAKASLQASQSAKLNPVNESYNLGMFKILEGDYASALQMMNNKKCDYNVALAQLLQKNYTVAKATLDCIPDANAKVYYLQAVLAARTANESNLYSNLRQAISKDAKLKAKAKRDPEFKKYRNTNEFQSIIK